MVYELLKVEVGVRRELQIFLLRLGTDWWKRAKAVCTGGRYPAQIAAGRLIHWKQTAGERKPRRALELQADAVLKGFPHSAGERLMRIH